MSQTRSIVSSVGALLGPAAAIDTAELGALTSPCSSAASSDTEAFLPTLSPKASSRLRTSTFSASTWLMGVGYEPAPVPGARGACVSLT